MVRPDPIIARRDHAQYWALCILSAAVLLATLILVAFGRPVFGRFIGSVDPLFAALTVSLILAAITPLSLKKGVFKICGEETASGILLAVGTASAFGMMIIIADMKIVSPRDMNVPFPESLLFYPVIGYGVEILFHALPLVVIALAVATQAKQRRLMFRRNSSCCGDRACFPDARRVCRGIPKLGGGVCFCARVRHKCMPAGYSSAVRFHVDVRVSARVLSDLAHRLGLLSIADPVLRNMRRAGDIEAVAPPVRVVSRANALAAKESAD